MQTRLTYLSFMVNKKMCVSFFVQYIYGCVCACGVRSGFDPLKLNYYEYPFQVGELFPSREMSWLRVQPLSNIFCLCDSNK